MYGYNINNLILEIGAEVQRRTELNKDNTSELVDSESLLLFAMLTMIQKFLETEGMKLVLWDKKNDRPLKPKIMTIEEIIEFNK